MSSAALALLVTLFFAHVLGDFTPLTTRSMLEAKAIGRPVGPVFAHAAVHAVLTAAAVTLASGADVASVGWAALIQLGAHFVIDWTRGRAGGRWPSLRDPSTQAFWTALGLDQFLHAATLLGIAAYVL